MRVGRALGAALLACVLAALAAAGVAAWSVWSAAEAILRPAGYARAGRALGPPNPSAAGLAFETVRIPTSSGALLSGWFVPAEQAAPFGVVLVHGEGSDRRVWLDHLPFLHEAGYALLAFDVRDHGASEGAGRGSGLGFREQHDVSAAVRWMKRERAQTRVAAFGVSLGADAVLLAAAGDPGIDVAIAESPLLGVDALVRAQAPRLPARLQRAVADLVELRAGALGEPGPFAVVSRIAPTPLVLIGSREDRLVSAGALVSLFARAREPKERWLAARGEHGAILAAQPDEYRERLLTYLRRWLGPARASAPPVSGQ